MVNSTFCFFYFTYAFRSSASLCYMPFLGQQSTKHEIQPGEGRYTSNRKPKPRSQVKAWLLSSPLSLAPSVTASTTRVTSMRVPPWTENSCWCAVLSARESRVDPPGYLILAIWVFISSECWPLPSNLIIVVALVLNNTKPMCVPGKKKGVSLFRFSKCRHLSV